MRSTKTDLVAPTSEMPNRSSRRRLPVGAEVLPDGVHFRVWAPLRKQVTVVFEPSAEHPNVPEPLALTSEAGGYFSGLSTTARHGMHYRLRLDDDRRLYADPVSRFQPDGCASPSQIVDPGLYQWQQPDWPGISIEGQVIYELHIGTLTEQGTWQAAEACLPKIADLGVTVLEIMPVAEFPGHFGWGYDGVLLFAPTRLYGPPDNFRHFVDEAHRLGMGVILDVVYNHFGPADNYLDQFAGNFVSSRHRTDWGDAINFDGQDCAPVREFFLANAGYWIDEYRLDGLRLDAIQAIMDDSPLHILVEMTRHCRKVADNRSVIITAESELQHAELIRPEADGGSGLDAAWNDDFHHSARVAMTGLNDGYYADFQGTPQELISAVQRGYLYQGQWNGRRQIYRGSATWGIPAARFITFLQNHDQVANSLNGRRIQSYTSPGRLRALTTLMLLAPQTPLLFMGQEFCSSQPFLYFADHHEELSKVIRQGRAESLHQFQTARSPEMNLFFADPGSIETFEKCKLDWQQYETNHEVVDMHRDLLRLRKSDPVFSRQDATTIHGAVLAAEAFALRYHGPDGDDRLLIVNLGRDLYWNNLAEPLLAPRQGTDWSLLFSTGNPRYGGPGIGILDTQRWHVPGHAALVLQPVGVT